MGKFYEALAGELALYVRQSAFLAAEVARAANDTRKPESRLEALRARLGGEYEPDMPPVDAGAHLLAYLFEIGPIAAGGMGGAPLSHAELAAWQANTGITLAPWEARLLRRLSAEYLLELREAESPDALPPWDAEAFAAEQRKAAAMSLRESLRGMAKKKPEVPT